MKNILLLPIFSVILSGIFVDSFEVTFDSNKNYEVSDNHCKIPCRKQRFDYSRDCFEAGSEEKCGCVAHCCWAFDCRIWSMFAQCRKKCRVVEWSRFGKAGSTRKNTDDSNQENTGKSKETACDHFHCPAHHLLDWDLRNLNVPDEINCVQHCCYAFNCKKYSGFCREACQRWANAGAGS